MKFGVVIFPGSNCDHDTTYLLENTLGQEVVELWHKDHDLQDCDFIVLPGGFSFGDYLRSGAIARFSPIMREVISFAEKGGYVMGICNGFQILCEAGLLPGALLHNPDRKFICTNSCLKVQATDTIITSQVDPEKALRIPVAHGEGSYHASPEVLQQLNANKQVLFRYCDSDGNFTEEANPNGSIENIAGICNQGRNVFGLMPHPERAADPILGNQDGLAVFQSILHAHDIVQSGSF